MVEFNLKKIIYLIIIIILIVALVIIVPKVTKKKDTKKEEVKTEEKQTQTDPSQDKEELDESDLVVSSGDIAKTVKCTKETKEENVLSEKLEVTFNVDEKNKVITKEHVAEYKFDKIDTEDYMSNLTIGKLANVLNKINGVTSTISTINHAEHTYRFTTIYDFRIVNTDDLYNRFYSIYFTNRLKDDFDKQYKTLEYDPMVKQYLDEGYSCK